MKNDDLERFMVELQKIALIKKNKARYTATTPREAPLTSTMALTNPTTVEAW